MDLETEMNVIEKAVIAAHCCTLADACSGCPILGECRASDGKTPSPIVQLLTSALTSLRSGSLRVVKMEGVEVVRGWTDHKRGNLFSEVCADDTSCPIEDNRRCEGCRPVEVLILPRDQKEAEGI